MKRIWFAGPRAWDGKEVIEEVVRKLEANYGIAGMLFITGGATGVDQLVEEVGVERGIHVIRVRACWPVGRQAGPMRNQLIARELAPDALIALHYFPLDATNHRGTQSAIKAATRRRIPVKVIRVKPATALPSSVANESPLGNKARAEQGLPPKVKHRNKHRRKP